MARPTLPLLALVLSLAYFSGHSASAAGTSSAAAATNFIKNSCSATTYPTLCFQSLSVYAPAIQRSPRQLAQTALSVSLDRAQSTRAFVNKLCKFRGLKAREHGALKDCLQEIGDTVDRLSSSVGELKKMGRPGSQDFQWHMSNVETWISAALTNENTCMDGFAGRVLNGRVKTSIRARFTHVAQVTSNALALVNQFASKY